MTNPFMITELDAFQDVNALMIAKLNALKDTRRILPCDHSRGRQTPSEHSLTVFTFGTAESNCSRQ